MNFIHHLINYFFFSSTMFFAAGAVATGAPSTGSPSSTGGTPITTGGGESGGGTTEGGSDGLQLGGDGADSSVDSQVAAAEDDFGDFGDDVFDDVEVQDAVSTKGQEEFGPGTYQKLKKSLATDPELFKTVKKGLSMLKRFSEHFETPEKAGELLGKLTTLGGIEGIEAELGETATFLTGFDAGDRGVIDKWLDEHSEGLPNAMPAVLDKWRSVDEPGWAHDAAQTFMATLNSAPVGGISALAAFNEIGKIPEVANSEHYKRIQQVLQAVQKTAETAPTKTAKPVDDGKLSAREKQVQQQEANLRKQSLGGKAAPILNTAASSALKTVVGSRKLSQESQKQLISDIHQEFSKLAAADKNAADNRQRLLQAGQDEQWLKMVKSAAERHMQTAARRVWRKYTGIAGLTTQQKDQRKVEGQQRREAGAGAATGSMKQEHPGDGRQVDWDRMRAELGGRDKADDAFAFGIKGKFGGKRFYYKKGDKSAVFTY